MIHIKGVRNRFADALSRAPVGKDNIPDYPLFANPVVVRKVHGLQSEPDFRVDM